MKIIKISFFLVPLLFFVISMKPSYLPFSLSEKICLIFILLSAQSDQTYLESAPLRLFFKKHKSIATPSSPSQPANAIAIPDLNIYMFYSKDFEGNAIKKGAIIATQSITLRLATKYLLIPNILKWFNINLTDTDGSNTSLLKLTSQDSERQSLPIVTRYDVIGYILKSTEYLIWLNCIRKPNKNMQIKSFVQTMSAQILFNTFLNIIIFLTPEFMLAQEKETGIHKTSGLYCFYVLLMALFINVSDFKNYIKEKITGKKVTPSFSDYQKVKWSNVNMIKEIFGLCAEAAFDSRSNTSFWQLLDLFFMDRRYRSNI